jgi:hypothetical protein
MPNQYVNTILDKIISDFGRVQKIGNGNSLFKIIANDVVIYFRYSRISRHRGQPSAFYGLRNEDLKLMEGKNAFVCFVWDEENSPVLIPFARFEYYFSLYPPANDGQYKVLLFFSRSGTEMYISKVGKFNLDAYFGTKALYDIGMRALKVPILSHSQVQSLIGAIGVKKGFDLWYPLNDRNSLDLSILDAAKIREKLPSYSSDINEIISSVDTIWLDGSKPANLFEVEHSTPVYCALLRFNDILLAIGDVGNFSIVADAERLEKFAKEVSRPTFQRNKLNDRVTFVTYDNVFNWYYNLYGKIYECAT